MLFAFIIDSCFRKEAWSMVVEVWIEKGSIENVDLRSPFLWDMYIPKELSHNGCIFTFCQSIIIGVPWSWFGKFNKEFFQEFCYTAINIFWAIVTMETPYDKREGFKHLLKGWHKIVFADFFNGTDDLELCHLIHRINVINAFYLILISLMHSINTDITRLPFRTRLSAFTNSNLSWLCFRAKKGVRSLLLHVLSVIYFKRITIALFGTGVVLYVKGINSKLNCKGCIDICKL